MSNKIFSFSASARSLVLSFAFALALTLALFRARSCSLCVVSDIALRSMKNKTERATIAAAAAKEIRMNERERGKQVTTKPQRQ